MACNIDFIEYICDLLSSFGEVRHRKMMGDYVIYLNEKCIITACDNMAFIKKLTCLEEIMQDAEIGHPYKGAKEAYILDISNQRLLQKVIPVLWDNLPYPKKYSQRFK